MSAIIHSKFIPLFTVFVLTAIATTVAQLLPPAKEFRPLGLVLDFVPIAGTVIATVIAAMRFKRASVPPMRLFLAVCCYFAGALIGALGVAHIVAVILAAIDQAQHQPFIYNFRFYSLLQLGVLLITAGFMAAIRALSLAGGDRAAWRASLFVWIAILAINLPLVPIQRFAIIFSVLAALELMLLCATRRHFNIQ